MDIKKIKSKDGENINVVIEIPKGSAIKYEIDKASGAIVVDRFLYTSFVYPFNYGFIPNTLAKDADPIDVLVLTDETVFPGAVIKCKVIGMLEMEDEEGIDTKIIAVPTAKIDPVFGSIEDISKVNQNILDKIKHFFENYKTLEKGKWVKIKEWKGKKEADLEIESLMI